MIEPTEFKVRNDIYLLEQNRVPLFAICHEANSSWFRCVGLFPQDKSKDNIFLSWQYNDGRMAKAINGIYVTGNSRERFIDYLFENYSEYAEWFLFHPEWL